VTGEGDPTIVSALKSWRTEQARDLAVPAYVVFPDRTLQALAAQRPSTMEDLLKVSGIGPAKAESYGEAILKLLADGPESGGSTTLDA